MKKEEYEAIRIVEEKTAAMLVRFARSERVRLNEEEESMIEECFEACFCNESRFPDIGRRCECWSLLRYCIMPCDRYELKLIERVLLEIAERQPKATK